MGKQVQTKTHNQPQMPKMPHTKQSAKKQKKKLPPALIEWAKDVKAYREKHSMSKANPMTYKQAMMGLSAERKKCKGKGCGCGGCTKKYGSGTTE